MTGVTRGSTLRRQVNALGMHGGEAQESKIFSTIGKCLCIWLIWKYAEALIDHEDVLFVLMLFLIAPDLIKKAVTMWFSRGMPAQGYTETSSSSERSVTTSPAVIKPIGPPEVP